MSSRSTILATVEIYHVFNRSVNRTPIFVGKKDCGFFHDASLFYLQSKPPTKYSMYRKNCDRYKMDYSDKLVSVICDSLMPNHFHFILKQLEEDGIQKFIQRTTSSFAHYFNIKNNKSGHLFERSFMAVRVETDEQLIHMTRYIHLNSTTDFLVNKPEDYPYSSYRHYLGLENDPLIDSSLVLDQFKNVDDYKKFVEERIDYQRKLKEIEHLIVE